MLLLMLMMGCAPDRYSECERTIAAICACGEGCSDTGEIAEDCAVADSDENDKTAEEMACYADVYEETCDDAEAREECY
jgi:hypothetical protein